MIRVKNLSFRYPNHKTPAVRDISFSVEAGEIFGFLGPSGSGKSTTQKILYKLLSGFEGEVAVMGKPLENWGREFYQKVGVGFELPNHYHKLTALENLSFFAAFYEKKPPHFLDLLARVGLQEDAHKQVRDFSKGMKMRLNFVRSFMHDPDLLFLDEPTSGLDPVNGQLIKNIILDLKRKGKTIFVTTHSMYDADTLCDRVGLIIDGEIKVIDQPSVLKLQYGEKKVALEIEGQDEIVEYEMEGLGRNPAFLKMIQENQIRTIHSKEATLEDVFIRVTGEQLHQAGNGA